VLLGHGYAIPTQHSTHILPALQTYGLLIRAGKTSVTFYRYVQYEQKILIINNLTVLIYKNKKNQKKV
jgi:hypothetical protein